VRIGIHPSASEETTEAAVWYEARQSGLGGDFVAEVDRGLAAIAESPERFPPWPGVAPSLGVRRLLLARFPYALAYRVGHDQVTVLAVAHLRRRPGYWRSRRG
jgi:plasmid stabilization system protein ParE